MYNDLFQIGPFTAHSYGLFIAIGVIVALFVAEKRAEKRGMDSAFLYPLTFVCVLGGFVSAKILFCIVEWKSFVQNPMAFLSSSGFVVYGGIIGGTLAAALYVKIKKYPFLDYFDIVLPSVAITQAFGRIGCFMAGCCYGIETDAWYGIVFQNSKYAPNHVKMIPTQLISSAGMFCIAAILFWFAKKNKKPGRVGALYLVLYSIGRFGIEFLRGDLRGAVGGLSTSQFISLFIVVLGLGIFFTRKEKAE